jgi:hypothetical protein
MASCLKETNSITNNKKSNIFIIVLTEDKFNEDNSCVREFENYFNEKYNNLGSKMLSHEQCISVILNRLNSILRKNTKEKTERIFKYRTGVINSLLEADKIYQEKNIKNLNNEVSEI